MHFRALKGKEHTLDSIRTYHDILQEYWLVEDLGDTLSRRGLELGLVHGDIWFMLATASIVQSLHREGTY